jgi:type I restriction enzyme S subunit
VKCIDDEIPFEIPQSWTWARLNDICCYIQRGKSPKYSQIKKYPVIAQKCNQWSGFSIEKAQFIEPSSLKSYGEERLLQDKDLLWNSTGLGTLGRIAIYKTELNPYELAVADSHVTVIRPIHDFVISEYLYAYFSSYTVQSVIEDKSDGSTKQKELSTATIKSYLMPLPPLNEQQRIINKIELLEPFINHFGEQEKTLNSFNEQVYSQLKKSVLQEAIQGKLVPQIASEGTAESLLEEIRTEKERLIKEKKIKRDKIDSVIFKGDDNKYYEKVGRDVIDITEEIPFEIPSTWCWCRVHTIFQLNPKNDAEDSAESAFVPMEKIAPGYGSSFIYDTVSWQQIKRGYTHFADGDIGFAKITPCFQNRKSVIFTGLPNGIGAGTTELKILRVYDNTIDRRFALSFLKSPYFIEQATFKGTANQQRIVSGYLENKLFPLPPINEQKRIVERLELLFNQLK